MIYQEIFCAGISNWRGKRYLYVHPVSSRPAGYELTELMEDLPQ